jgi:flagellar protein FliO/FliZ
MTQDAVLRVVIGLVLVVAVILALAWMARRTGFVPRPDGTALRLVAKLALGPRSSIAVVQVQDTWIVVGLTPNSITPLHTLPAQPSGDPGASADDEKFSRTLAARMSQALKRP